MTLTTWPAFSSGVSAQAGPLLQINGPERVEVGEPIVFTLTARGVAAVGGYETTMLFDTSVAQFHQIEQSHSDLKTRFGRDIEPLAAVQVPYGAAIGLISCPVLDCLDRSEPGQTQGGRGTVELARVTIGASQPGILEVRFDAIKVVTAIGVPLPINIPAQTFNIQVGPDDAGPRFTAPARPWTLPTSTMGSSRPVDVTGSGQVTYTDLMELALDWQTLREHGAPCATLPDTNRDINGDGCIDVADLQMVAAQLGLAAASNHTTQSANLEALEQTYTLQQTTIKTYVVNSTGDEGDANRGNSICATSTGTCTLRAAIQEANNDKASSRIEFAISGTDVQTIVLTKELPTLADDNGPTTIDGYTQPGSAPNTHSTVSNAVIQVQIEGAGDTQFRAIAITTPGNVIQGLAWYKFERVFFVSGRDANDNVFVGNFVGTNAGGTYGASSVSSTQAHGLHIQQGAKRNRVGGVPAAERNVISGNARTGVSMWHGGTNGNMVYNNLIGLRPDGTRCLPNRIHGSDMNYGASNNVVGGLLPGQRNVLTGNGFAGIDISHGDTTTGNQAVGNFLGTDVDGTGTVSNCSNNQWGFRIKDGVRNNTVSDNVIGGSCVAGIEILSPPQEGNTYTTTNNTITRNRIGVGVNDAAIPNPVGVLVNGRNNKIGPDNIIARNSGNGVQLDYAESVFNTITRNSIYSNGKLGIDLAPNGVTPNDTDDADSGPNQNLNFPVLDSATTGEVTGTACGSCKVEIFIADSAETAYGEGKTFVGSATANADGTFVVPVTGVSGGLVVTSTATDSNGNTSEFSLNRTVSGSTTAPAAPTDLTATTVSSTRIDLSWTDGSNNEAEFVVELSFDETSWSTLATLAADTTSYSHTTARVNTTYFYRVVATNSTGSSEPSNVATATTATALPGRIEAEDYREGGSGFGYYDTTSGNSGGTYRSDAVDIQATQDVGGGFNVGWVDTGEWLVFDVTVATSGTYNFTLRLASPNSGRTLHIEVDGTDVTGPITVPNTGAWQTWTDVTVGPYTIAAGSHTFKIAMDSADFNINYVDVSQAATGNPPAAPSDLVATAVSSTQIDLAWADNSNNESNFVVERSIDGSSWTIIATLDADAVSFSDTAVEPETTYYYQVTATNSDGSSDPSNIATATTPAQATDVPAAPSALTATTMSSTRIDLAWTDGSDNEANFVVERSFDQTSWAALITLPADTSSYNDTSVRVNTTYFYRVVATNSAGSSAPSETASAATATALPGRIEIEDYREGGTGFGHFDTTTGNAGGAYRNDDVDIQLTQDTAGTHNVGWIDASEWLAYDVIAGADGNYTFTARVASPNSGKKFRIEINGTDLTGSITVPKTGSWQKWTNVTVGPFPITAGSHTLRIVMETNGFNLNYLDVSVAP